MPVVPGRTLHLLFVLAPAFIHPALSTRAFSALYLESHSLVGLARCSVLHFIHTKPPAQPCATTNKGVLLLLPALL